MIAEIVAFLQQHRRLVLIFSAVLIIGLIAWAIIYNVFVFHITSVTPNPNNASYQSPRLVVGFNKELVADNLVVKSEDLAVTSRIEGNKLIIDLSDMVARKTYPIVIESIQSKGGSVIKNHTIILRAVTGDDSLTDEDMNIILERQQAGKSVVFNDPIFADLPHSTLDYAIDAEVFNAGTQFEKIVITITVKLASSDVKSNRAAAITRYQQSAMDYLNSLEGITLEDYTIETKVVDPL